MGGISAPMGDIDPVPYFPRRYADARAAFLAAAPVAGLDLASHPMPGLSGIDGEALAMDVATSAPEAATGTLLVTSGTHGIEGYCGSGAQVALMHDARFLRAARDARVALVFVHSVNPHGFSFGRRVNEDNVDLNRNFRDFTQPPPDGAAYARIHDLLLPSSWPPSSENAAQIAAVVAAQGARAFQAAVTGGQYDFPRGMFYGGAGPTWSNRTLRDILSRHVAIRRRCAWIDIHTGLGPRGHGEKIFAGRNRAPDLARARAWWGPDVTSIYDQSSSSSILAGLMFNAAYEECPEVEYAGIGLEFGTLPLPDMLKALRGDHWLDLHPDANLALGAEIRARMRAAFYIEADDWKRTVYAQVRDAAHAALSPLAADAR